ncbi:hypothetical protein Swit_2465 [Rhizorhabdus wittichii RW1]|uniref:Integrase DNA-binding domain-containing protein n=1 Tax=Rhizorhabdus wittichii (strain DSM 6014 / CCUG 31198 / JCM 15750 / NBRC 105917 / EY 4224 / RW1) TaxID=392499 RepID=A0A9J9LE62_RHIWR|nr:hypothetical protein Swit_2465 [Rhizorhabdus wittichii RW1]
MGTDVGISMGKLTALKVKSAGVGRHADGDGLYLHVKGSDARSWLLRMQSDGKRRDFGLGSVDTSMRSKEVTDAARGVPILQRKLLTLAEAREKAEAYRRLIRSGLDPVAEQKMSIGVQTGPPIGAQKGPPFTMAQG